jgi:adiponectin receptor
MEWIDIYGKEKHEKLRRWPLFVFLFSAMLCLLFSSIFHLFYVHSLSLSRLLGKLDYAGISLLIAGSCYPPYYYFYYCSLSIFYINNYFHIVEFMYFYLSFITIFSIAVFIFSLQPNFGVPSKRSLRGFLFLTLGLSTSLPMVHIIFFSNTITGMIPNPTLTNWVLGGICYVAGCLIYVNRFPERKWPGKFCIWVRIILMK